MSELGPIALVWNNFGPYHVARVKALGELLHETTIHAVQTADRTTTYAWKSGAESVESDLKINTLIPGAIAENISPIEVFFKFRKFLQQRAIQIAFLPSYWPADSAALLFAAKSLGVRVIMMNESHAGTERATGIKKWIKQQLVNSFDASLVGGEPHRRYFKSFGIPENNIFIGYDAIDNMYFQKAANYLRADVAVVRQRYGLPERYLLSLGRFVPKKNLRTLIEAYAELVLNPRASFEPPALVLVGSGEEEAALVERCRELGLQVMIRLKAPHQIEGQPAIKGSAVYFYGFRQIEENPIFYALAEAFVLPSLYEEWGLVVNEAMASGLPVLVSQTAGCAEDLVKEGENGFLFDPTNGQDLAEKLFKVTSNDSLRKAMCERSQEIIAKWGCDNFARQAIRAAKAALREE